MRPSHPRLETVGERGPPRVLLNPDSCMGRNPYRQGRDTRMAQKMDVVGIDVAKATLDAYALTSQQARQFANDAAGHQGLVAWLQELGIGVVVFEASGGYERAAAQSLRRAGLVAHVVDPKRVRYYARAAGQLAKTDRIDARMIAAFGAAFLRGRPSGIAGAEDPARQDLAELVGTRQVLVDHRTGLQQQADAVTSAIAKKLLLAPLKQLDRQIETCDRQIAAAIARHEPFAALARRLDTVPGLGPLSPPARERQEAQGRLDRLPAHAAHHPQRHGGSPAGLEPDQAASRRAGGCVRRRRPTGRRTAPTACRAKRTGGPAGSRPTAAKRARDSASLDAAGPPVHTPLTTYSEY